MRERLRPLVFLVFILTLAVLVRVRAALELPVDFDEPVYVGAGMHYAQAIRAGDLGEIVRYDGNLEHPVLVKLFYGLGTALWAPDVRFDVTGGPFGALQGASSDGALTVSRLISVGFGLTLVLLVMGVEPLAGLALAIHTMNAKYTSQAYLEALPAFSSALCVLAYARSQGRTGARGRPDRWFWLSALALGVTAASKYVYLVAGLAVLGWVAWDVRRGALQRRDLFLFVLIALFAFILLDPILWADPLGRLIDSVTFHGVYSQGVEVTRFGYPWWKPLDYMFNSYPAQWHKGVFFLAFDELLFVLGMVGLGWLLLRTRLGDLVRRGWDRALGTLTEPRVFSRGVTAPQDDARRARREGLILTWFSVGLVFLFLWPTKWPQYTLITATPLCLAAGLVAREGVRWLRGERAYWGPSALEPFVRQIGLLAGTLGLALMIFVTGQSLAQRHNLQGWMNFIPETSPLPSKIVQAVAVDQAGRVWFGTARGLAVLELPARGQDARPRWTIYNQDNSGLAGDDVLAIAPGEDGQMWIGTNQALCRFDTRREAWTTFAPASSPLLGGSFHDIEIAPDGNVWIATTRQVSVLTPAGEWQAYSTTNSGLLSDEVLDIAVEQSLAGTRIWFATTQGVSALDLDRDTWKTYTSEDSGLVSDAVSGVAVDEGGQIWFTTFGRGISMLSVDGRWQAFHPSDSGLPWGNVLTVVPGCRCGEGAAWLWFGTAGPETSGGEPLAAFVPPALAPGDTSRAEADDAGRWRAYGYRNSGLPDSAVSDIAVQCFEGTTDSGDSKVCSGLRVWVATRTAGAVMYEIPNP